jgi:hypothetical protein
VTTVICAVATVEMSAAASVMVKWDEFTNAVGRPAPLNCATENGTKPFPFTVKVRPVPPAATPFGDREVTTGIG